MIEINSFAHSTWRNGLGALFLPDAGTGTTTWPDYSGHGNTATLQGTAAFATATGFNSRRVFGIGNGGATITDHSSLDIGASATIAAWVYMTADGISGDGYLCNIFSDDASTQFQTILLRVGSSSESLRRRPQLVLRIDSNWRILSSDQNINLNTWTFLAGTVGDGYIKLYKDGSELESDSFPYTPQNYAYQWLIGKSNIVGQPRLWPGSIGMVAYWPQRALSAGEIKGLYEATK